MLLVVTLPGWWLTPVHASEVVHHTLYSSLLQRSVPYTVILPDSYTADRSVARGSVYLLHCAGCSDQTWLQSSGGDIDALIDHYNLIAVAPFDGSGSGGGTFSWWLDSPRLPRSQWSSFLYSELVPHIDSTYAVRADRRFRALSGHSMGGYGALHNLIEHPDVFAMAFGIKGGYDPRYPNSSFWPGYFDFDLLLGSDPDVFTQYNVLQNVCRLTTAPQPLYLGFYSGVNDTWFANENRRLDSIASACGLPHRFNETAEDHFTVPAEQMDAILHWFDSLFTAAAAQLPVAPDPLRGAVPASPHSDRATRATIDGRVLDPAPDLPRALHIFVRPQ
jgi:S-formylglutathione hydrolase FrmB